MGTGIELSAGSIVGRDFRVVRPLAEGGMGAVYVVEQLSTGKARALKVMHARFAADPRSRERFELEARASARVASDHVVEVVAAGVDEATNTPWLVMELLDGETHDAALARRGALPPDEAHEVFAQLGHALAAAHAVGIVHRDLKPENVVLAAPRRAGVPFTVKVLDFGIAKLLTERAGSNTQAMGSPHWMAPEQTVTGAPIGAPTDVWALGLIAYQVITGLEYWRSAQDDATNPMALFVEVGAGALAPASERAAEQGRAHLLPAGFDAWFARCVVREMTARFPDGAEATAALLPLLRAPAAQRTPIAFAPTEAVPVYTAPLPATMDMPAVPVALPPTAALPAVGTAQWGSPPTAPPTWTPHAPPAPQAPPAPLPRRARWLIPAGVALVVGGGAAAALLPLDPEDAPVSPRGGVVAPAAPPTVAPAAPDDEVPFRASQRWEGSYVCSGAHTPLVLRIVAVTRSQVDALFEFTTSAGATGVVRMSGPYVSSTRRLTLTPGQWVRQPPGFIAVAMDGTVAPDDEGYSGRMLHPSCEGFSLRMVED
ncbi:MAG: serine/threonine-protein kinase [Deltaproteobacteria bacterium]|nr:serine/threonine-protein kinase [Deltaproteobacteria bacterium]